MQLRNLIIILGDQLDEASSAFVGFDPKLDAIWMAEVEEESTHVISSKQRITFFLSAMRHFSKLLQAKKWPVIYATLDDPQNTGTLASELEKIIADTEIEEKDLRKKSEEARAHIDERLLYSYDRIRNSYRNGLAVVTVERDACGGCFNSIPPQRQSEIRLHKKIIVCENCGRILVEGELAIK
jgi:RNase P subunit RPR2